MKRPTLCWPSAVDDSPAMGAVLRRVRASVAPSQPETGVNSLYQQVVARHPLGIPRGADTKAARRGTVRTPLEQCLLR
jgi:hypothetical protein